MLCPVGLVDSAGKDAASLATEKLGKKRLKLLVVAGGATRSGLSEPMRLLLIFVDEERAGFCWSRILSLVWVISFMLL